VTKTVSLKLSEIAAHVGGELVGADIEVTEIASLRSADAGAMSFVSDKKYIEDAQSSRASALIVGDFDINFSGSLIRCKSPYLAYAKATHLFSPFKNKPVIAESASVASSATIGANVSIGPNAVVDEGANIGCGTCIGAGAYIGRDVILGEQCFIDVNAVVHHSVSLGHRVRIGSCSVIGGEGFGYAPSEHGWVRICQLGSVEIHDDCDIGPGCTIDRGALDNTIIERGVILDDQVHIAHNVRIGENSAMAGCSGIAGSTIIGKRVTIAGMVGIVGHIEIHDDVHVTAMSLVTKSITKPGSYSSGTPLSDSATWRKNAARFGGLDRWYRDVRKQLNPKN